MIVRGTGVRRIKEKREHGEGGINRSRSNKTRVKERSKQMDINTRMNETCSLFHTQAKERMKTKSTFLAFIHGPFEGSFNPNSLPSFLALNWHNCPTAYNELEYNILPKCRMLLA